MDRLLEIKYLVNKIKIKTKSIEYTKKIVLIGMFAATITGGKIALMALPNIEVVTLLIMLYTYVFGLGMGLSATLIFCTVEMFIFPINSWVISYYIYWPFLAIVTFMFKKLIMKNRVVIPLIIAVVMTTMFGVLTSLVDTLVFTSPDLYWKMFAAMYIRGIPFFVTHIVSNALVVGLGFLPLSKVLMKLKEQFFPKENELKNKDIL